MKAKGNRWIRIPLIFATIVAWSAGAATGDFDLPEWALENTSAHWFPGDGLWPEGALPEGALAYIEKISGDSEPQKAEPTEYVLLREESAIESASALIDPETRDDLPPIEKELKNQFFGTKPAQYLIDPQNLITEQKANDILRFLEIHAGESRFKIYPIVVGMHQAIPKSIDLKKLHKNWFGESPAIMFAYTIQKPESLQLVYNKTVEEKIPVPALARIRKNCITEAKLADNGPDQLERIAIELSIQAFLLEKLINRGPLPLEIEVTSVEEIARPAPVEKPEPAVRPAEFEGIRNITKEWIGKTFTVDLIKWIVTACSALLLLAVLLFLKGIISKKRTAGRNPILFPCYTPVERLGGEFTGGSYVGISFEPGRSNGRIE